MPKSYKRETGWAALLFVGTMGVLGALGSEGALSIFDMAILPVIALNAATLGLDSLSKQFNFSWSKR